jgi:prevent-host-death family protein
MTSIYGVTPRPSPLHVALFQLVIQKDHVPRGSEVVVAVVAGTTLNSEEFDTRQRPRVDNMTRSGQIRAMKQTNVSGLKARLSEYLNAVRNGETVVVHDRRTPIARLVPISENTEELSITEPSRPIGALKIKPPRLRRRVDVVRLLRESRDHR